MMESPRSIATVSPVPLVQAVPAVAEPLPGPSLGPATNPSREMDM